MSEEVQMEEDEEELSAPFWMVTFSDMVTLLLTFFVMIVSMSEVEIKKFQEALSYFQGNIGVLDNPSAISSMVRSFVTESPGQGMEEHFEEILRYLEKEGLIDEVQVFLTKEGIHLVITDSLMFHSGEAELIESSKSILQLLGGVKDVGIQSVLVEGHTDNIPIHTDRFPSNWELSGARASSVVRFLLENDYALDPERYTAIGYGEYRPLVSNDTPANRARNRRVEILFSWEPWQKKIPTYQQMLPVPQTLPNPKERKPSS